MIKNKNNKNNGYEVALIFADYISALLRMYILNRAWNNGLFALPSV